MATPETSRAGLMQGLGLLDATMLVAGSMIGSGIFIVSADIARQVGSPAWLLVTWLITGLLTLAAALSYGELAALMPRAGGQYVYLREAFGPLCGFLYGWTLFLVIQTGTIAAVAAAFARFLGVLVPQFSESQVWFRLGWLTLTPAKVVAIAVLAFLSWSNATGLRAGRAVQNSFTLAKIAALVLLILVGLSQAFTRSTLADNLQLGWSPFHLQPASGSSGFENAPLGTLALLLALGTAMVGSLFSSDAWNNVTFTAGEVRNPRRNLPLSLLFGVSLVSILYLLANLAYLCVLPLRGSPTGVTFAERGIQFAQNDRVATAAAELVFGPGAAAFMAVLIMISTFGCMNGMILAGARVYYAMSQDRLFFHRAAQLNTNGVPANALLLQCLWAALLVLSGSYGQLLDYVIFAVLLFYVLTIAGLFVLRRTRPHAERPYRAFGYPVVPALYIVFASLITLDLLLSAKTRGNTWPGLLLVISGAPVYFIWKRLGPSGGT